MERNFKMPQTVSKEIPLGELTLRRYEKPGMAGRDLVKKLCLSLGLLQPGDSRDVIVDVLLVLLQARQRKEMLYSEAIKDKVIELRRNSNLPLSGIASSNIRRQLKRLKDLFLIESEANYYRISEFSSVSEIFQEKIESFYLQSLLARVKEYTQKVDEEFK
ncbi:MAG TPA: hypothetical protein VJG31_00225 [Candidatus Nanoarchaeia archaeon]|nr:hypothetical protein [Candidatus Nanoarchaeia archaeon]